MVKKVESDVSALTKRFMLMKEEDKNSAETLNKNVQDMNASKLKRQFESSEANKKLNNKKLAIEHAGMDKNRFASQMEALSRAPSASGKARTLTKEKVRE